MRRLVLLAEVLAVALAVVGTVCAAEVTVVGKVVVKTDSDGLITGVSITADDETYVCVVDDNARRLGGTMKDKNARVIGNLEGEGESRTLQVLVYTDADVEADVDLPRDEEEDAAGDKAEDETEEDSGE